MWFGTRSDSRKRQSAATARRLTDACDRLPSLMQPRLEVLEERRLFNGQPVISIGDVWVNEGNVFEATVMAQAWVIDRSATTRWQGPIVGKSSRWGRSQAVTNFLEAFGDATLDSAVKLATTPDFRASFAAQ